MIVDILSEIFESFLQCPSKGMPRPKSSSSLKTGIPYSGTHCLRHGMATLARKVGGMGLDSVVAMTGHKDLKLAAHYSKIDGEVQRDISLKIFRSYSAVRVC